MYLRDREQLVLSYCEEFGIAAKSHASYSATNSCLGFAPFLDNNANPFKSGCKRKSLSCCIFAAMILSSAEVDITCIDSCIDDSHNDFTVVTIKCGLILHCSCFPEILGKSSDLQLFPSGGQLIPCRMIPVNNETRVVVFVAFIHLQAIKKCLC